MHGLKFAHDVQVFGEVCKFFSQRYQPDFAKWINAGAQEYVNPDMAGDIGTWNQMQQVIAHPEWGGYRFFWRLSDEVTYCIPYELEVGATAALAMHPLRGKGSLVRST